MQQFLNFLTLPQGHGSLRPTFLPSGLRGSVSRGGGGNEGLAFATSAAFLPVSFSRANSSKPFGSSSSSLTRRQCSSFSASSVASHSSYSENRKPLSSKSSSG